MLAGVDVWCHRAAARGQDIKLLVAAAGGRWLLQQPSQRPLAAAEAPPPDQGRPALFLSTGDELDPEFLREAACTQILRLHGRQLRRQPSMATASAGA